MVHGSLKVELRQLKRSLKQCLFRHHEYRMTINHAMILDDFIKYLISLNELT